MRELFKQEAEKEKHEKIKEFTLRQIRSDLKKKVKINMLAASDGKRMSPKLKLPSIDTTRSPSSKMSPKEYFSVDFST